MNTRQLMINNVKGINKYIPEEKLNSMSIPILFNNMHPTARKDFKDRFKICINNVEFYNRENHQCSINGIIVEDLKEKIILETFEGNHIPIERINIIRINKLD